MTATPLTSILFLALAVAAGAIAGALANLAADALPALRNRKSQSRAAFLAGFFSGRRPVLHYLTLPARLFRRGICPHCGECRPLRAPLLELAMMVVFAVIAWRFPAEPLRVALYWLYAWFLLTVLVIDFEHRLVLNIMTAPAAVVAFAASFLPGMPTPQQALLGGALAFAGFFLLALVGHGAMGMGDVKLAGVIGLMTGHPLMLPALLTGIILGGLAAAVLLISRRATRQTAIAYAPYLSVGALAILVLMR